MSDIIRSPGCFGVLRILKQYWDAGEGLISNFCSMVLQQYSTVSHPCCSMVFHIFYGVAPIAAIKDATLYMVSYYVVEQCSKVSDTIRSPGCFGVCGF